MVTQSVHGPIYIGGPDRCGKTLVAAVLGSHSRIAIPIVGSNLWTYFYGQYGDLSDDRNLDRCLGAMLRYKHARFLELDSDRLRHDLRAGTPSYARLFALVHQHFAERQGKARWGDQTGLVERYADRIFGALPDVRMIQMVRDPRDRYEGSLRMWPSGRGRAGAAVARWRYSVDLGERNRRRWPERYRLLRYEDLVREPEAVVRDLCAFVGEAFEPGMLEMRDAPTYRAKLKAGAGEGPLINADHIGDYLGRIPAHELAFMQQQLGSRMRRYGYRPDATPMPPLARVRYHVVQWPVQRARMAAWAALEAIQHRLSGVVGRRPSAAMVVAANASSPSGGGRQRSPEE
jgi:hypothetical protein